eukprot:m.18294 g.18294  ORF g.18294 m.18294 type:complete len:922 (+) comp10783_c0_seq1:67-2832(+)
MDDKQEAFVQPIKQVRPSMDASTRSMDVSTQEDNAAAHDEAREQSCTHAICNDPFFAAHVEPSLVGKFIKCLCQHGHCAVEMDFKPDKQLLAMLFGHVQSGKTDTFIMVALVLFLKYNLGALGFLLNNASVYANITDSVKSFNDKLESYGLTIYEARRISMVVSTLKSSRPGLTDLQMRPDMPALYGRILCKTGVKGGFASAIKFIGKCGTDDNGYLNVLLIIDEAHNVNASQNADLLGLENAVNTQSLVNYRGAMRCEMMKFFKAPDGSADLNRIDALLAKVDERGWTARNLFKVILYVTATTTPIALTEAERNIQLLEVPLPNDYYGYGACVDIHHRIIQVEEVFHETMLRSLPNIIAKAPWVIDRMDEYMAPEKAYQHVLVYAGGKNAGRVDLATALASRYQDVPMVTICLFGNNCGYGALMVFSEAAVGIAEQVAAAEKALHCNNDDLVDQSKKPPPGTMVMVKEGQERCYRHPYGGHLEEAVQKGKALFALDATVDIQGRDVRIPQIRFPSNLNYRDRVLLNIVRKATKLAGFPLEQLKIVGIGMQLLKEGVTLKTTDHQLPPTAMFYAAPAGDDVKLIQATGRIAGRQRDGAIPKLHATKEVLDRVNRAYSLLDECNQGVRAGHEASIPPAMAIAQRETFGSLTAGNFLNPRSFNQPALRHLLTTQQENVSQFHGLSAAEAKAQIAAIVGRVVEQQGWIFSAQYLKAVANAAPADSDYCCEEHHDIDLWTTCDKCVLAIAKRSILKRMLTKARPNKKERFYQVVTALGYYASAAGLSCFGGWPLAVEDNEPCWRDVALGSGSKEQYADSLVGQSGFVSEFTPLHRLDNGLWAVKPDWWRHANADDGFGSIGAIPVTLTDLYGCLPPADDYKLKMYMKSSSTPAATGSKPPSAVADRDAGMVDLGDGPAKRPHLMD